MSDPAPRRARLLRLRAIEHRVAAVRCAAAEAAYGSVAGIAARVARLRGEIAVGKGFADAANLQSLAELADRLARAEDALAPALAQAQTVSAARQSERAAAGLAEERLSRVHAEASRREGDARDLRAAATQPWLRKRVEVQP